MTFKRKPNSLSFTKFELKFIYSFLIKFNDFGNIVTHLTNPELDLLNKKYNPETNETRKGQLAPTIKISRVLNADAEDETIAHCILLSKDWDKKVEYQVYCNDTVGINVFICMSARIHDSGMATYTITLETTEEMNELSISDFNLLFRLVERVSDGNNFVYIKKTSDNEEDSKYRLDLLFKDYLIDLKKQLCGLEQKESIEFIGQEYIFDESNADFISQNPYVISIGQLEQENYNKIFLSNNKVKDNVRNEISFLLLRVINLSDENNYNLKQKDLKNINLDYIREYFEFNEVKNIPINLAMDNRMYYQFHPRCCLILTPDINSDPSSFLIPSIQNTLEITRTRWYSGIVINAILDTVIHKLRNGYSPIEADLLKEIIGIKKLYSQLLENPVIYGFEGGSVTAIAKIAEKKMWLDEIIDLTLNKIDIINQINNDRKAAYYAEKTGDLLDL